MPRLIREGGIRDQDLHLDHPSPHVHVAKAGAIVKIDLSHHHAVEIVGSMSDRHVKRAEQLVARHAEQLKQEWEKLHGVPKRDRKGS